MTSNDAGPESNIGLYRSHHYGVFLLLLMAHNTCNCFHFDWITKNSASSMSLQVVVPCNSCIPQRCMQQLFLGPHIRSRQGCTDPILRHSHATYHSMNFVLVTYGSIKELEQYCAPTLTSGVPISRLTKRVASTSWRCHTCNIKMLAYCWC